MRLTLNLLETALTGRAESGPETDRLLGMVRTDSRRVIPGDVFFCLAGEHADGHRFAVAALDAGAGLVVAHKEIPGADPGKILPVDDTLAALGRLARFQRDRTGAKVLAVTGTAGKTSVKEMLALVASRELRTCKNYKNYNNQIGLPLAILAAEPEADLWVLELGISRPGDMDDLGRIAAPDLALITNVGPAHLEGLGSVQGVAQAKASLLAHLVPGGTAILCRDHALLMDEAAKHAPAAVVEFSARDDSAPYSCLYRGTNGAAQAGNGTFKLKTPEFKAKMVLPLCGDHWAENIAAVAAAAGTLGLSRQAVLGGISAFRPSGQRFVRRCFGGLTLIDDSYNANPLSMTQAIRTARSLAGDDPLVLVLGDMLELGDAAAEAHEALGRILREVHPTAVFFQGGQAENVARGFRANGTALQPVTGPEDILPVIDSLGLNRGVILVKGSRSCRMERYVTALADRFCAIPADPETDQGTGR